MTPTSAPERPTLPKALRRDSLWTFGLLGASALLWMVGIPGSLFVLLTGPAAIAFAASALINSRGVDAVAGIRVWLWVSMAMGAMILLAGLSQVLTYGPTQSWQACRDRAITETAKRECEVQYEKDRKELLDRYSQYGRVSTG